MWIGIALILVLLIAAGSIVISSLLYGISPMPSSLKAKQTIRQIPLLKIPDQVVELGSGFGGLARDLAARFPDAEVTGYERSPFVYLISYILSFPYKNLSLLYQNFFRISLSSADLIVCYLYPKAMEKLAKKFKAELKEGTWIISNTFAIPGWQPYAFYEIEDAWHTKIYIYKVNKST